MSKITKIKLCFYFLFCYLRTENMNLPFFLSRRIYGNDTESQKVSRPAIRIAIAGVAIGLAVMIISVSVVIGFKQEIRNKVVGFGGSIQVANMLTMQSSETYPIIVSDSLLDRLSHIEGIRHAERFAYTQGLLKTDDDFLGITLKGVSREWDSTFIHSNMREGSLPTFSQDSSTNNIVVSRSIANRLKIHVGERIFAYFFDGKGVRTRRFNIVGIYETNLSQYDDITCFTDLYTTIRLNGWDSDQVHGAELFVDDFDHLEQVADEVAQEVDRAEDPNGSLLMSKTIREMNPQIFAWLDLLDMNVWIILLLMMLVAGVTMVSGLLIIILERTSMIGTLKALGSRNSSIQRTFLWFGTFITLRGILIGDGIALLILLLQRYFGLVRLDPHTYYVSQVPVDFNIPLFLLINLATLLVSILVLLLPSLLISHIKPAKAIKFD